MDGRSVTGKQEVIGHDKKTRLNFSHFKPLARLVWIDAKSREVTL